jgi:hypothetical protein
MNVIYLLFLGAVGVSFRLGLLLCLAFLEKRLGDEDLVLGGNGAAHISNWT